MLSTNFYPRYSVKIIYISVTHIGCWKCCCFCLSETSEAWYEKYMKNMITKNNKKIFFNPIFWKAFRPIDYYHHHNGDMTPNLLLLLFWCKWLWWCENSVSKKKIRYDKFPIDVWEGRYGRLFVFPVVFFIFFFFFFSDLELETNNNNKSRSHLIKINIYKQITYHPPYHHYDHHRHMRIFIITENNNDTFSVYHRH